MRILKGVTACNLHKIRKIELIKSDQTTKIIFMEAGRSRNSNSNKKSTPAKRPPVTTIHESLRVEWARTFMKQDIQHVFFSDEMRATLDGPDESAKK